MPRCRCKKPSLHHRPPACPRRKARSCRSIIGDEEATLAASRLLAEEGFLAAAIRPPTVPAGTARLRLTFTAQHPDDQIARLADIVRDKILATLTVAAYFVTSTGTDIGKTFVTAGLIRYLRDAGAGGARAQAGGERLRFFRRRDQRSGGAARSARPAGHRRRNREHRALALPRAAVARSRRRARRPQHRFRRS